MKQFFIGLITCCFILAGAVAAMAANNLVPPFGDQQVTLANGVSYLAGTLSNNDRAQMNINNQAYNLKLIFDYEAVGPVSLINVKVQDSKGKVLIDEVSKGPWFFAKLPEGRYRVTTYFHDQYEIRNITVHSLPQTVVVNWTL